METIATQENRIRENYAEFTRLLIERGLTITTMESATAGQIASLITDTEGSSAVLKGAFVTYSNSAKIMQGVSGHIIENYGVYSRETAKAMARAAQRQYHADIAIGVTGTMGNVDPDNPEGIPGNVYFAICYGEKSYVYHEKIPYQSTRLMYKLVVADLILEKMKEII